jgi:hypothetical protein
MHIGILEYLLRITKFMHLSCSTEEQTLELKKDLKLASTPSKSHVVYRSSDLPLHSDAYSQQSFFREYSMSRDACVAIYKSMTMELATYSQHASSFEVRRKMNDFCVILKGMANTFMKNIVMEDVRMWGDGGGFVDSWTVLWLVSLLVNGCCVMAEVVELLCLPMLDSFLETKDVPPLITLM